MTTFTEQQLIANFTGALAHVLTGKPGRHSEFMKNVTLMVAGREPTLMNLMQLTPFVRQTRRPLLWVHSPLETPALPRIGLLALDGEQLHILENCLLWMPVGGGKATLIPDRFDVGAFRFRSNLTLARSSRAPIRDFNAAKLGILRALSRLHELRRIQIERGEIFALPELRKAA